MYRKRGYLIRTARVLQTCTTDAGGIHEKSCLGHEWRGSRLCGSGGELGGDGKSDEETIG